MQVIHNKAMPTTHDCSGHYKQQTDEKLFTCDGCKMNGFGPRYVCQLCDMTLHKVCRYPKPIVTDHEFFGHAIFTFKQLPYVTLGQNSRCSACQVKILGYSYHCEALNLYLHPCCWKLERKLEVDGLVYDLTEKNTFACVQCPKNHVSPFSEGWSYACFYGGFSVHVYCMIDMVHNNKLTEKLETSTQRSNSFTNVRNLVASSWDWIKSFFRYVVEKFKEFGQWCFQKVKEVARKYSDMIITEDFFDRVILKYLKAKGFSMTDIEEIMTKLIALYYSYFPFFGNMNPGAVPARSFRAGSELPALIGALRPVIYDSCEY